MWPLKMEEHFRASARFSLHFSPLISGLFTLFFYHTYILFHTCCVVVRSCMLCAFSHTPQGFHTIASLWLLISCFIEHTFYSNIPIIRLHQPIVSIAFHSSSLSFYFLILRSFFSFFLLLPPPAHSRSLHSQLLSHARYSLSHLKIFISSHLDPYHSYYIYTSLSLLFAIPGCYRKFLFFFYTYFSHHPP